MSLHEKLFIPLPTKSLFFLLLLSLNYFVDHLSSIYVFSYFPFGFEGRIWDLIVSVPDHCLSFYFGNRCNTCLGVLGV